MQLRLQVQQHSVADEVSAITAVVRPILEGVLYALKTDVVAEVGTYDDVKLKMLPRLYRRGDRDCGICFEYAVHEALNRGEPSVVERVYDAMTRCSVPGNDPASILFGAEKAGALNLINTAKERLTEESGLLYGTRGRPAKLKRHIDSLAAAFRKQRERDALPWSISGLWKADLFFGNVDSDRWVATTVKINPNHLEGARGLRIGIVPAREGKTDLVQMNESKNLVICPLPYDHAFMEAFYQGWQVVQTFIAADAKLPKEVALPRFAERQVARYLADRREYRVVDVVDTLQTLSQPELLQTEEQDATLISRRESEPEVETGTVVAPMANRSR
ncbi:MAG: hypothetical protein WKF53_14675 [Rubrobacter sp.]